jgi:hypothetical protein
MSFLQGIDVMND